MYRYTSKTPDENFNTYDNALNVINKITNGEIKLSETKNNQIKLKLVLGKIKKENNKKILKEQKSI